MQVMPEIGTTLNLPVAGVCEVVFVSNNQTTLRADNGYVYIIPNGIMSAYYAVVKGELK